MGVINQLYLNMQTLRFWWLYLFSIVFLGFTFYMWSLGGQISDKIKVNLKRLFFSIWVLITSIIMTCLSEGDINEFGKNKFGFSETIWLTMLMFIIGAILYFTIISDKDLVIRDNKLQSQEFEKELEKSVQQTISVMEDLESKINNYYHIYMNISDYVNITLNNDPFDYIQGLQLVLNSYYQYNQGIDIMITTTDGVVRLNFNKQELANSIASNTVLSTKMEDAYYLLIPIMSMIYDLDMIYIILKSDDVFYENEYKLIITLLDRYEVELINTI